MTQHVPINLAALVMRRSRGLTYTILDYGHADTSRNILPACAVKVAWNIPPAELPQEFVDLVQILRENSIKSGIQLEGDFLVELGGYHFWFSYEPPFPGEVAKKSDAIKPAAVGLLGKLMGQYKVDDGFKRSLVEMLRTGIAKEIDERIAMMRAEGDLIMAMLAEARGEIA